MKRSTLLTLGIIFMMISIIPTNLAVNLQEKFSPVACSVFTDDLTHHNIITISEEDTTKLKDRIISLMNDLETEETRSDVLFSALRILSFFESLRQDKLIPEAGKLLDIDLNPLGKRVFIISHGSAPITNPLNKQKIQLLKPATLMWYYSGKQDGLLQDKTLILDPRLNPYPTLDMTKVDGRQIGIMTRFVGLYISIPRPSSAQSSVFFIGYAYKALGLDLSPFKQ